MAAFLVFTWHFLHVNDLHTAVVPAYPFSILTEGHVGVALFMCLSGYLFAKLLDGKNINYSSFMWNRALRLLPLLMFVVILVGIEKYLEGSDFSLYLHKIAVGFIKPSLPNGGWSITVEFHFYVILPFLLFASRRWKYALVLLVVAAVLGRLLLLVESAEVKWYSYFTIVGRIDQFVLGILAYQLRSEIAGRHMYAASLILVFLAFYRWFEVQGGFFATPAFTSQELVWVFMPTIEGVVFAFLIAWYDNSFTHSTGRLSRFIALIGTCSYSIYLLHFSYVFRVANRIDQHVFDLTNVYVAFLFSIVAFVAFVPIAFLSFKYIEMPLLRYRTKYVVGEVRRQGQ